MNTVLSVFVPPPKQAQEEVEAQVPEAERDDHQDLHGAHAQAQSQAQAQAQAQAQGLDAGGRGGEGSGEESAHEANSSGAEQCRICTAGWEAGRLFRPCKCNGSIKLVHVDCINTWRRLSRNQSSYYECDMCKYKYNIERTNFAEYMQRFRVPEVLTLLLFVVSVLVFGNLSRLNVQDYIYDQVQARRIRNLYTQHTKVDKLSIRVSFVWA
jgi:hypothetical protein